MYIMKINKYYKLEPLSYPQSPLFNSEPLARMYQVRDERPKKEVHPLETLSPIPAWKRENQQVPLKHNKQRSDQVGPLFLLLISLYIFRLIYLFLHELQMNIF